MISGFNTDVESGGVVYHIQTEDKGLSSKKIISLVYVGGTILASKRASYDDLDAANFDEKVVAERLQKQHRLICAAIKAGRINELKEMTAKAAAVRNGSAAIPPTEPTITEVPVAAPEVFTVAPAAEVFDAANALPNAVPESPTQSYVTNPAETESFDIPLTELFDVEPIYEAVSIVEDEEVFPAEAVEVVSELSGRERPSNEKLGVELLGDFKFKGGDRQTVNIMVCRGTGRKVVPGAQIMIKVLGSSFRPVIFHAKSDANGLAKIHLQLPHFQAGRAALLIRAMDLGEEIELRRVVMPG